MRQIVKYPDPVLLKPAEDFNFETDKPLLEELEMVEREGGSWGTMVGLAAPQIGISKRFFIALEKMYVNPEIVEFSEETYEASEGCYSLEDHTQYPVTRHKEVTMKWQDRTGRHHEKKFDGFRAEVLQHEHDHLMGKLCCR